MLGDQPPPEIELLPCSNRSDCIGSTRWISDFMSHSSAHQAVAVMKHCEAAHLQISSVFVLQRQSKIIEVVTLSQSLPDSYSSLLVNQSLRSWSHEVHDITARRVEIFPLLWPLLPYHDPILGGGFMAFSCFLITSLAIHLPYRRL